MAGKVINVPLDADARDELTMCAYRKWSEAVDNLTASQKLIFDKKIYGSKLDFELSKKSCIENAEKEISKWNAILNQIKEYSPLIFGA